LRCVYLSDTSGVHDTRWCAALETLGYTVNKELTPELPPNTPIIIGPLTADKQKLLSLNHPVIGLSWGFDLHELVATNNTDWLNQLEGLIVDSTPTRQIAIEAGMNPSQIAMIPWGIDLDLFSPTETRALNNEIKILTLRAHEPLYRIDVVIDAVSILQQQGTLCSLVIGNSGTLTEQLAQQVNQLNLHNVEFTGRLSETQLPELFSRADVYVSAAETDGTSVTLLQAMAMEVPVVVSNSPGNETLLLGEPQKPALGRIFELNDPESLARQIQQTVKNSVITSAQVEAAREYVLREADWPANIKRLGDLIASISPST